MSTLTWNNYFSSSSDLNVFRYTDNNSNASVTIENNAMKLTSSTLDAYKTPILYGSDIGIENITNISFIAKHSNIGGRGCFPNITLYYESGEWVRIYLYNNFIWSGYTEDIWQQLFANRGYAIAYASDTSVTRLWSNTSSTVMSEYFNVNISKLLNGNLTINMPGTTSNYTIVPPASFANKKISKVEFGIIKHWYNNGVTCYIDNLFIEGKTTDDIWVNVNGAWKKGEVWVNINGVWKQGETWVNVNGVWKKSE